MIIAAGSVGAVALALAIARVFSARAIAIGAGALAMVCVLAGPTAYSLSTVSRSISGPFAAAGPDAILRLAGGPSGLGGGPDGGSFTPLGMSTSSSSTADISLANYLLANKGSAEYLVAVQGAQSAESLILATGQPVMAMGGFNGADPAPTLAEFQQLVAAKKVRYVLVGGGQGFAGPPSGRPGGPPPGGGGFPGGLGGSSATFSAISQWVEQNGTVVDAGQYGVSTGGGTLYQLW